MIVVDASVLAPALADDHFEGDRARQRLRGEGLAAPQILDLEVMSVWRGLVRAGDLSARRASFAIDDLRDLPVTRFPHLPLLARAWRLRDNLSLYDAAYVTLAELLGCALVTTDRRLAAAPGIGCRVDVLS